MRSVRIWFTKTGEAAYISHLDINRYMTRALRRAHIPLWYTEGFNTHPYITFALPLSLGIESSCESMDIRIEQEMSDEEIKKRLNDVMADGIEITEVTEPKMKANEIAFAEYEIIFEFENEAERFADKARELLSGEELMAEKLGKSGHKKVQKQINLIEHIKNHDIQRKDNTVRMEVTLPAGNSLNINPSLLTEVLQKKTDMSAELVKIERSRLTNAEGVTFE